MRSSKGEHATIERSSDDALKARTLHGGVPAGGRLGSFPRAGETAAWSVFPRHGDGDFDGGVLVSSPFFPLSIFLGLGFRDFEIKLISF